jgi:hypothetical protein
VDGASQHRQEQLTWRSQPSSTLLLTWRRFIVAARWSAFRLLARRLSLLVRAVVGLLLRLRVGLRCGSLALSLGSLSCVFVHVIVAVVVLLSLHPSALLVIIAVIPLLVTTLVIAVIVVLLVILVILIIVALVLVLLSLLRTSLVVVLLLLSLLRVVAVVLLLVRHGGVVG